MNELTTYTDYREFKQALDTEMHNAVEGFVRIGYLLNVAATTDILLESGYRNVNELAKAEYGLEATQVSRFINIHKRFGVPGEARLQSRYENHGVAKLGLMLTLPDYINEEISSEYSRAEINAIKAEVEAEQQITPLEVMAEEKDPVQQALPDELKQALYQLVHDMPQEYIRMYNAMGLDEMKEILVPSGEATYVVRVPGVGRLLIFAKETEDIVITNVRSGSKERYAWVQLYNAMEEYFAMGSDAKDSWSNVFNEEFPESKKAEEQKSVKEEPKSEPKPEPKKEPKKESKKESKVKVAKAPIMPEPVEDKPEVLVGEVEDVVEDEVDNEQQDNTEIAPVQGDKTLTGYKAAISHGIKRLPELLESENWDKFIVEAERMVWRAKQLKHAAESKS